MSGSSEHTTLSTLPCPKCGKDIPGGQYNLKTHIGSAACLKKIKDDKKKKPIHNLLTGYFSKPVPLVPSTVAAPVPVQGSTSNTIATPIGTGPEPLHEVDPGWFATVVCDYPDRVVKRCEEAQTLMRGLRGRILTIPEHAPLASITHRLAIFGGNPSRQFRLQEHDPVNDWDGILLPLLRKAFGWGQLDLNDSAPYISAGANGLDGFCDFFDVFILDRNLKGHRIRPYFHFLLDAIRLRFSLSSVAPSAHAKRVQDELHRALPRAEEDHTVEFKKQVPCPGLNLRFPAGRSHHEDYPFALHKQFVLPWDYYSRRDEFFLQSRDCEQELVTAGNGCKHCNKLLLNDVLRGIIQRISFGVHQNTPLIYMPISGLIDVVRRKTEAGRALKLTKLNVVRKLLGKMAALDDHKQFVMAIASGRMERVAQLVQACLSNGVGIRGLLERYHRACREVYNAKGFTEDDIMLGLLILRLGGARLAGIVHRAKGLPGISTLRANTVIRPLRASPGIPTIAEIEYNIDACAEGEPESIGPPEIVHRVLMLDEIAVDQRPRWDDKTNMIVGVCRECSGKISLEFNTAADLEVFFNALDDGDIHLACEATVAAFGALSKNPRVYSPRPCCISGTDKHEKGPEQAKFINQILTAAKNKQTRGNITYRTISIASDGEAKRGAALVQLTMNRNLSPDSPIYPLLSMLEFMNFRVGADDVTADKDYRHVLKTLRNLLMRMKGVLTLDFVITPAVIKQHLRAAGHSQQQVNSSLNPNDKQDVLLGYELLKALWSLPVAPPGSEPTFVRTQEALYMFGQLGYHLLMPYIFVNLSLHQQLAHLSTAAHLLIILYSDDSSGKPAATSFMANQTYMNLMIMIKNVFFCIAKTKIDIPDAEFFIILLGTDRLEVLFGLIRTAIGTDANIDVYQLCTRASNLTESTIILTSRPHWDRSPRRLKLPMIINEAGDISPNADHITPASWKGDIHVRNVNLLTAWKLGRQKAEQLIPRGRAILARCSRAPGADIFGPLGPSLIHYIDEDSPEDFEIDPSLLSAANPEVNVERGTPTPDATSECDQTPAVDQSYTPDGDVEDALAIAEPQGKFSPYVEIEGKMLTKAKALSSMMRYRGARSSTDRLKRVAGLPCFNPTMEGSGTSSDSAFGAPSLRVGNPVAMVVSCEEQLFLAVAQVNNIQLASSPVQSIALDMLLDSSAKISVQILRLHPATIEDESTEKNDWRWSLSFEATCTDVPENLIHPLNPVVAVLEAGKPTYLFDSAMLLTAAATIHDQMLPADILLAPSVKRTIAFPYRHKGRACFIVEHEGTTRDGPDTNDTTVCSECVPNVHLGANGQRVLEHMGAHVLFDPAFSSVLQQACGGCLRSAPLCKLYFNPRRGTSAARQVDWSRSTWGKPFKFSMAYASVSKDADSPCSNVPVECSLCDADSPLVWSYNLAGHWREHHNRAIGPFTYKILNRNRNISHIEYKISDNELKWMRAKWKRRFDNNTSAKSKKGKATTALQISEAHSSSMALRNPAAEQEAPEGQQNHEHLNTSVVQSVVLQDDEDEFGSELPSAPSPGPLPDRYPSDEESDTCEFPAGIAADSDAEAEVLPSDNNPPGFGDFIADSTTIHGLPQQDWDLPLIAGVATRSRLKRRVRDSTVGACEYCGLTVSDAEREADPGFAVQCNKAGCETAWYHRECLETQGILPSKNWLYITADKTDNPVTEQSLLEAWNAGARDTSAVLPSHVSLADQIFFPAITVDFPSGDAEARWRSFKSEFAIDNISPDRKQALIAAALVQEPTVNAATLEAMHSDGPIYGPQPDEEEDPEIQA